MQPAAPPDPLAADRRFFAALLARDAAALDGLLAADFMLIDVMAGSEVPRDAIIGLVGSGQLQFHSIQPSEQKVRCHAATAIVTGRTRMAGSFGPTPFSAESRYTHVFLQQAGHWRLVAAQGTRIVADAGATAG